jgi:hypothetical protein
MDVHRAGTFPSPKVPQAYVIVDAATIMVRNREQPATVGRNDQFMTANVFALQERKWLACGGVPK